jgi:hypothetical protein
MHFDLNTTQRRTRTAMLLCTAATTLALSTSSSVAARSLAPPDVAPAALDVCSLLSPAKVSALTGRTYTSGKPNTIVAGVDSCVYSATEGYALSVTIYGAPNRATLDTLVRDIGGAKSATSVTGVGDQAFASPVGLVAKFGSHLLEVGSPATTGSSTAVIPGYVAVAKAVIAAMH